MSLDASILALIEGQARFEDVAADVFAHQYSASAAYRRLCDAQQRAPAAELDWRLIPAVPIEAFRGQSLTCFPPERCVATFLSSGTTSAERGRHDFDTLALYRAGAMRRFGAALAPTGRRRIVSLIPDASARPDSSLSQMVSWALETFGTDESGVDESGLSAATGAPALVLGTAFGLATWLEQNPTLQLPAGSAIMETGGFKGQRQELTRDDLFQLYERAGVPSACVVGEYGMAELSSQWYDGVVGQAGPPETRVYWPAPWARTRVVDPQTRRDVAPGETGLLLHVDPVNRGSVQAVLTQDLGRRITPSADVAPPDGPPRDGFVYVGRARLAALKGCGLVDEP